MSIFKNDVSNIRQVCPWSTVDESLLTQTNDTHSVVFSSPPHTLEVCVKCPGDPTEPHYSVTALALVSLPPGCQALTDYFVFTTTFTTPLSSVLSSESMIDFAPIFDPLNTSLSFTDFMLELRNASAPLTFDSYASLPDPLIPTVLFHLAFH